MPPPQVCPPEFLKDLFLAALSLREIETALSEVPDEVREEVIELLGAREAYQAEVSELVIRHLTDKGL